MDGKFHSISKSQVADLTREKSLMPKMEGSPPSARSDGVSYAARTAGAGPASTQTVDRQRHSLRRYRAPKAGEWPTYHGSLNGNRHSPLDQINTGNVAQLAPKWMFPMPGAQRAADDTGRRGRHDVRDRGQRGMGPRRPHRPRDLALQPAANAGPGRRRGERHQSRCGRPRRPRLHGHRQRAPDRAASPDRPAAVGRRDGRLSPALRRDRRAAGGQRSRDRRSLRRRRRRPRLSRRLQATTGERVWRFWTVPGAASRARKPGSAKRSNTAAAPLGSPAPTIRKRDCSTGRPAILVPTTTATSARATTSTRTRCWRSIRRPAS